MSNAAERIHHKYSMSKWNYLEACAGFESRNSTTFAAEEGTRLHDIMETAVKIVANDPRANTFERVLSGFNLDDDDRALIMFCAKELDRWLAAGFHTIVHEIKVPIFNPDGSELAHGYLDILLQRESFAVLVDYKFGWEPVPPAEINRQGLGYALGCFQKFESLKTIGTLFLQPRLNRVTRKVYERADAGGMYRIARRIIASAEAPAKRLNPGPQCDYCLHNGVCSALANVSTQALQVIEPLPMPISFHADKIQTVQDVIKALYVRDRLRAFFEEANKALDEKAKEILKFNGERIEQELPDGRTIVVELKRRNSPRSAHSPLLIADALAPAIGEVAAMQVVLASCDPQVTKLEDNFADKLVERSKEHPEEVFESIEGEAPKKITKKFAKQLLDATLRSEGLLSAPDRKIEYLKVRLEKPIGSTETMQIENTHHDQNHTKEETR